MSAVVQDQRRYRDAERRGGRKERIAHCKGLLRHPQFHELGEVLEVVGHALGTVGGRFLVARRQHPQQLEHPRVFIGDVDGVGQVLAHGLGRVAFLRLAQGRLDPRLDPGALSLLEGRHERRVAIKVRVDGHVRHAQARGDAPDGDALGA